MKRLFVGALLSLLWLDTAHAAPIIEATFEFERWHQIDYMDSTGYSRGTGSITYEDQTSRILSLKMREANGDWWMASLPQSSADLSWDMYCCFDGPEGDGYYGTDSTAPIRLKDNNGAEYFFPISELNSWVDKGAPASLSGHLYGMWADLTDAPGFSTISDLGPGYTTIFGYFIEKHTVSAPEPSLGVAGMGVGLLAIFLRRRSKANARIAKPERYRGNAWRAGATQIVTQP